MAGVVGPFLGGIVSVAFGYRTNFFAAALLTVAGLYLLVFRGWGPGKR